jgi:hypothetical protein
MPDQRTSEAQTDAWFPLEAELKADADGARRDALLERVRRRAAEVKGRIDHGLPPNEYADAERLHAGLEAAAHVVMLVWARHHGRAA